MKYAQGIIGLLLGTALGGSVIAATTESTANAGDKDSIRAIVREVIKEEPQLIVDSLTEWQRKEQSDKNAALSEALKDPEILAAVHSTQDSPFVGDADSKKVVVEFFDYNCPACKMQFQEIETLRKAHPDVKIIFKEYPIFGAQSEANSKIGLAVHRVAPEKYFAWHSKMMGNQGRTDEAAALKYAADVGIDAEKVKAEAATPEVDAILAAERELGNTLKLQGTPSLVIGDELVPHAMRSEEIIKKFEEAK